MSDMVAAAMLVLLMGIAVAWPLFVDKEIYMEDEKVERNCLTCRWWDVEALGDDYGYRDCHRHAPTIPVVDYETDDGIEVHLKTKAGDCVYTTWPKTDCDDWCGDWEER